MNEKGQPRGRLADKGRRQGPAVMLPRSVQVECLVIEREDATCLLEVRIRVASVVREELVFEVSEANHVVATPVFVHKLAAALLVDVL